MAIELEKQPPVLDPRPAIVVHPPIHQMVTIQVLNAPNFQEATLRKLITPRVEVEQNARRVSITSQGLSLTEERRTNGQEAILLEVAARYRHGEGAIKQLYRYLIFMENGTTYCQRLPMGSWAPTDPDICLEWLGRGGLQQGDFVLLPRTRLPNGCLELKRPQRNAFQRAMEGVKAFIGETLLDDDGNSDWERLIGRHNPVDCRIYKRENRLYLEAPHDTRSIHPEHAPLSIPKGVYEIVEDRASSYWRKAID